MKHLYDEHNLVEQLLNKIKHYRRRVIRYENTALSLASILLLVAVMTWLR